MAALLGTDERQLHTYLSYTLLASGLGAFVTLLDFPAPYGRHTRAVGWGPLVPARRAWIIMESPNVLVSLVLWQVGDATCKASPANRALLGLFFLHYLNRSFIYPLRMAPPSRPMPLSVMGMAWAFCTLNGYLQARALTKFHVYPSSWVWTPAVVGGVVIFLLGFLVNVDADRRLRELRSSSRSGTNGVRTRRQAAAAKAVGGAPGHYGIPHGGLFEYVSCANFTGECVEWAGFALACGATLPAVTFAVFTAFNLAPRALAHHKWYRAHFKEKYPAHRKCLIPFVF